MINKDIINRINELTAISRKRDLTEIESTEREKLRKEYLKSFKTNLRSVLDNIEVVDNNEAK